MYVVATLGIVHNLQTNSQRFFHGHDGDCTALAMHPDGITFASGQLQCKRHRPTILVWSSQSYSRISGEAEGTETALPLLCKIEGDHTRGIAALAFCQRNGNLLATMGMDDRHLVIVYRWARGVAVVEKMRVCQCTGFTDSPLVSPRVEGSWLEPKVFSMVFSASEDVFALVGSNAHLSLNGFNQNPEEDYRRVIRDRALARGDGNLWSKRVLLDVRGEPLVKDVASVAFGGWGSDGLVVYVGADGGRIFRVVNFRVSGAIVREHHGKPVSALACDESRDPTRLLSAGHDGSLCMWMVDKWTKRDPPQFVTRINLEAFVSAALPVHDDFPSAGAVHSLCISGPSTVLVGTVANEIVEVDLVRDATVRGLDDNLVLSATSHPLRMPIVSGHFDEMWGLSMHPQLPEAATVGNDGMLRIWDLRHKLPLHSHPLHGPGRCCAYSPNGSLIAVGLEFPARQQEGKSAGSKCEDIRRKAGWYVYAVNESRQSRELHHGELEPVSDFSTDATDTRARGLRWLAVRAIRFSPNAYHLAVGRDDGVIDVFAVLGGYCRVQVVCGHSSAIRCLDWALDSCQLRSSCSAHEQLYWRLFESQGGAEEIQPHESRWASHTCFMGPDLIGIWPFHCDGTDINACARTPAEDWPLMFAATADDFGQVKLFRWPCTRPRAQHACYTGHAANVTNVAFSADGSLLLSIGGNDRTVFQWELSQTPRLCR